MNSNRIDRRGFMGMVAGAAGLALSSGAARAEGAFPSKPITCLVPWGVGGGASTVSDLVSKISAELNLSPQPIVLDHRPGASGLIGTALVAERKGDPYVFMPGGAALLPQVIVGESPVHPLKDLAPLAMNALDSSIVFTRKDSPFNTMADVFDKLKKEPKSVTMAGAGGGPGSWDGMLETVIGAGAGVQFNQIPFGGGGDVQAAILGGQVDVGTRQLSDARDLLEAGQAKALVIFDEERNPSLPDVPTMRELGYDAVLNLPRGWLSPAGIKPEEVQWYEELFKQVSASKTWDDFCKRSGIINKYLDAKGWTDLMANNLKTIETTYKRIGIVK